MARVFADARPDAVVNLAAETHVDRSIDSPEPFIDTNIVGTFMLLEAAQTARGGARAGRARGCSAFCTCRPTRSTGRSDRPACSARRRRTRRTRRTPPARPRPIIWSASYFHTYGLPALDHELFEQLRAVPVSREAHPADDSERARRPSAADLRRRRQRPRLAARRGSLRRHAAGAARGTRGREVQYRRRQRAHESRDRRSHLRRARRDASGAREPPAR